MGKNPTHVKRKLNGAAKRGGLAGEVENLEKCCVGLQGPSVVAPHCPSAPRAASSLVLAAGSELAGNSPGGQGVLGIWTALSPQQVVAKMGGSMPWEGGPGKEKSRGGGG